MTTASPQADGQELPSAEMLGFAIALLVEAFIGFGILDQIGLASLLSQG